MAPGGDVLVGRAGELRFLVAVHLPEPAEEHGLAQRLRGPGPLLDHAVVAAGGDVGRLDVLAVPADHRDPALVQVPPLGLGGEGVVPGIEVVVDVERAAELGLEALHGRLLGVEAADLGAGAGPEEHAAEGLGRGQRGGRGGATGCRNLNRQRASVRRQHADGRAVITVDVGLAHDQRAIAEIVGCSWRHVEQLGIIAAASAKPFKRTRHTNLRSVIRVRGHAAVEANGLPILEPIGAIGRCGNFHGIRRSAG